MKKYLSLILITTFALACAPAEETTKTGGGTNRRTPGGTTKPKPADDELLNMGLEQVANSMDLYFISSLFHAYLSNPLKMECIQSENAEIVFTNCPLYNLYSGKITLHKNSNSFLFKGTFTVTSSQSGKEILLNFQLRSILDNSKVLHSQLAVSSIESPNDVSHFHLVSDFISNLGGEVLKFTAKPVIQYQANLEDVFEIHYSSNLGLKANFASYNMEANYDLSVTKNHLQSQSKGNLKIEQSASGICETISSPKKCLVRVLQ